jgi:enterochelin esterase family protein
MTTEIPYARQPDDFPGPVHYEHGPDSFRRRGVPQGTIIDHAWSDSRVFPGTNRRYWVYVPAQYTASEPASLIVFQDGHVYVDPEGEMRELVERRRQIAGAMGFTVESADLYEVTVMELEGAG